MGVLEAFCWPMGLPVFAWSFDACGAADRCPSTGRGGGRSARPSIAARAALGPAQLPALWSLLVSYRR
jgi:hypothetical protein